MLDSSNLNMGKYICYKFQIVNLQNIPKDNFQHSDFQLYPKTSLVNIKYTLWLFPYIEGIDENKANNFAKPNRIQWDNLEHILYCFGHKDDILIHFVNSN